MIEIYKDIPNYNGLYQISNLGNIKSLHYNNTNEEKLLQIQTNKNGYKFVVLHNKGTNKLCFIHRLVMQSFSDNYNDDLQVNHIDGNKENNYIDNLEMCTSKENINHAWKNGLCKIDNDKLENMRKKSIEKCNKKILQFDINNNFIKEFENLKQVCELLDIDKSYLIKRLKDNKQCKSFYFRYKEVA